MVDRVLIPLPGVGTLALSLDAYRQALADGALACSAPVASTAATDEAPLVDSDALAAVLGLPVTWVEEKARQGVLPSYEFGRWRRFKRSEVEAAMRARGQ